MLFVGTLRARVVKRGTPGRILGTRTRDRGVRFSGNRLCSVIRRRASSCSLIRGVRKTGAFSRPRLSGKALGLWGRREMGKSLKIFGFTSLLIRFGRRPWARRFAFAWGF